MTSLQVTEIYASIQGESSFAGIPCTFVRLTGCPLRCRWCDTAYAFEGGRPMEMAEIVDEVQSHGLPLVELTGGEPMAQLATPELAKVLVAEGYQLLLETGGSEDLRGLPECVHIIMDLKAPGSAMHDRNLWSNLDVLKPTDEIKFVLADHDDFLWARQAVADHDLENRFRVLYSCAFGLLKPEQLATWMVEERVAGRMQLQMHKYIWHPRAKGV